MDGRLNLSIFMANLQSLKKFFLKVRGMLRAFFCLTLLMGEGMLAKFFYY